MLEGAGDVGATCCRQLCFLLLATLVTLLQAIGEYWGAYLFIADELIRRFTEDSVEKNISRKHQRCKRYKS